MKRHLLLFLFMCIFTNLFAQKTVFRPTEFDDPNNEYYNNVSETRKYESANFVLYWGDKVGTNPAIYADATLRFNPQSVADTLEYIFKRYITDLHFINNAPTTNFGKYKIMIMMVNTWSSSDPRLTGFASASSFSNTIGAMYVHPQATKDGGALSHEFAHTLQMMMHIQENPGNQTAFSGYDWAGPFYEGHANYMRAMAYPQWADTDGTLTRWIQTRHFMWSSNRHHYTNYHLLFYVQEKEGFDFTRRMWAESKYQEHPLETIKRLKGFTQEQLNDYLWGYAQRQPAFDYPIQWNDQITATKNFGSKIREVYQSIKSNMPRYTSRQFTLLTKVAGTTDQYYTNDDWAPQDYGMNVIPLYPTCTETVKKVTVKFKGHTEVNTAQAGWRYGFVTTKADGTISRYSPMSTGDGEASFTMDAATEANIFLVVYSAPKTHINYNMDVGYPKQRRYPYELKIANAVPEGYQAAADFRKFLKTNGKLHTNGGGWISNNASVAATVYVGPYAIVKGGTLTGTVRVEDYATVEGGNISGSAIIRGNAYVYNATISGNAIVEGNAWMEGGSVINTANLKGNAMCWAATYSGSVIVGGDAEVGSCAAGVYMQAPYWRNGRTDCDGKGATDVSNVDINATFTNFTAAQMAFTTTPTCTDVVTTYTLATTVVGSGTVSPSSGTFNAGTVQTLTATPATGYTFTGWSGDATGTTNPLSVTMTSNKNITATFTINKYTLATTVVGSGTVSPASGSFNYNTVQTLTATPATGYTFTGWSGDATGTTNPLSVTMTANKNITATFTINKYTLATTVVGSGTVSPASGSFNYNTVQTLTATPAAGYTFTGWSGDATGTTNPLSVTMTANKNITATFTINKYTLATTVVGSGTVSPANGSFNYNTVQTLTATPAAGYTFTGWSGDATGTTNPLSVTMTANKNITATFTINKYTLATTVVGSGMVSLASGSFNYNTVQTLTATPATGYTFTGWSGDATGTTNPLSVTMTANKNITATFTINKYTLATTVVGSGTVSPANGSFNYNTVQTLTATPATGYTFTGWSGDATGTTNPLSVTMTANKNITATFTINKYTLATTVVGSGTVSPANGSFNYNTVQTLTATPAAGYTFTGWSGDATGTTNPLSVTMTANKNITATFTINKYTLATTVVGSGTVSPASGSFNYNTVQTLTATPAAGYTFTGWSGDATGTTNPLSVTMTANKNITATFTINKYTLATTLVGSGTVSPASGSFNYNTVQTLTATPATGYTFTGWSGDATGTTNPLSVTLDGNKTITATFAAITYTFTATIVGAGEVNPTGSYPAGTAQVITATPASGYVFSGWSGDFSGTTNPLTVTIDGDKHVTAKFTAIATGVNVSVDPFKGTISPNPSNNTFKIELLAPTDVDVYSLDGKLVLSYKHVTTTVFGEELQAGLYIVKAGEGYYKVIKE